MARWSWWLVSLLVFSSCPPTKAPCETAECGASMACNPGTGQCEPLPACTPQQGCAQGSCVGDVCSTCAANILCTAGFTSCDPASGQCGVCRTNADCPALQPVCLGAYGCVECAVDADCPAATPLCTNKHLCGVCNASSDCASGQRCQGGLCLDDCDANGACPAGERAKCTPWGCSECWLTRDCPPGQGCYGTDCRPAPPGDLCLTAIPIPFASGSVLLQGTLSHFVGEEVDGTVTDLFFKLEVAEESALNLDLTLSEQLLSKGTAELYTRCGGPGLASGTTLRDVFVVPGTYFIRLVSSLVSPSFTLHVWTTPKTQAAGSQCLEPIRLALDAQGHATVTGDTRGLAAAGTGTCGTGTGRLLYEVELPVRSNVTARLHPLESTFDAELDLKRECLVSRPDKCGTGNAGADRLVELEADLGPVTVQVGDVNGTSGSFELDVQVSPIATNGSCDTAAELAFDGGVASARGLQHAPFSFASCTCYQLDCGEGRQVWRLSTRGLGTRSLQLRLTPDGAAPPPGLSLLTECNLELPEPATVACDGRSTTGVRRLDVPSLPEGDYFVEVGSASSAFLLEASLGPAFPLPANDDCTSPQVLDLVAGTMALSGDTRGATPDTPPSCPGDGPVGRDVVYRVQAAQRGRATFTVTPGLASFDPVLYVHDDCSGGSARACANDAGVGGVETLGFDLNGTSPRFLWLKGAADTAGPFQLASSFTPAPANDTCAGATALTLPQTVSGNLSGAFNDFTSCDAAASGPDVFYRFTYTGSNNGTVNVTLTPSGFDGRLHVLTTSCGASCTRFVNDAGVGLPETLALPVTRNGVYFLGVDGDAPGAFTLSVQ